MTTLESTITDPVAVDPVALTRSLVDIDSTTGREAEVAGWLARYLAGRGYTVTEQPISNGRAWPLSSRKVAFIASE